MWLVVCLQIIIFSIFNASCQPASISCYLSILVSILISRYLPIYLPGAGRYGCDHDRSDRQHASPLPAVDQHEPLTGEVGGQRAWNHNLEQEYFFISSSVVDLDPVGSALLGRTRICIKTEKTDLARIRVA